MPLTMGCRQRSRPKPPWLITCIIYQGLGPAQRSSEVFRTVKPRGLQLFVFDFEATSMMFQQTFYYGYSHLYCPRILYKPVPEPFSRKAGIRAAIQSSFPSAIAWRLMTLIAPLKVKTSGASNPIIGSIPRHHHHNSPGESTSSSHLADGGVCLEFRRSGNHASGAIFRDA